MTIAERLRKEGHEEDLKEGFVVSSREDVLEVLKLRFEELPESVADKIRSIEDHETLKQLHRHAVVAETPNQFQAELGALE